eukprot:Gb_15884 [translate_table: standard]
MGRSEGGLAVVTMQQSPQTNIGMSGNLRMKNNNSNNNKVVNEEETNDTFPVGMRVLVVDDDPICLLLLENLLRSCQYQGHRFTRKGLLLRSGYEVRNFASFPKGFILAKLCKNFTTCGQAMTALNLLRENKDKFDLVISDVYMPDMDGFKLLELVGLEMDLPVIMMSANGETSAVMKGITHGACDYLLKPVRLEELKNIWQHVVRKKKTDTKDHDHAGPGDEIDKINRGTEDGEHGSSANDGTDRSWKLNRKRKDQNDDDEEDDENEHDNDDPSALKKPRVVWSVELHQQFVSAVNQLGIDKAVPKRILELMNVQGLTRENVASHLQKYRLYLKRLSGVANHQGTIGGAFGGGRESSFASLGSVDGLGDLQALAVSGQLSVHALASLQAGVLGRLNGPGGLGIPGLNSSGMLSLAALQGSNNRAQRVSHSMNNPGNMLPCLPTGLELEQLQQKQQISRLGDLGSPMDDPARFHAIQHQLSAINSLNVGSGGGSGNLAVNPTNNALLLQLMQQQQQQQQKQCRGLRTLPSAGIVSQRPGPNDISMGISCQLPNTAGLNGSWGNGAALSGFASNTHSLGAPLSNTNNSMQSLRENLLRVSNIDCKSMDISIPSVNAVIGSPSHNLSTRKDLCLSSVSAINTNMGNINECVPFDNVRPKFPILGNMNVGLRQDMNHIVKQDWQSSPDFGPISNPVLSPQCSQASLLNQKFVGTYGAQVPGQTTGFCEQKMNLPIRLPVNSVVPMFGGQCDNEQSTADSQMQQRENSVLEHVKVENGFFSENCNSTDELMNILFKQVDCLSAVNMGLYDLGELELSLFSWFLQQHESTGLADGEMGCDSYPLETYCHATSGHVWQVHRAWRLEQALCKATGCHSMIIDKCSS